MDVGINSSFERLVDNVRVQCHLYEQRIVRLATVEAALTPLLKRVTDMTHDQRMACTHTKDVLMKLVEMRDLLNLMIDNDGRPLVSKSGTAPFVRQSPVSTGSDDQSVHRGQVASHGYPLSDAQRGRVRAARDKVLRLMQIPAGNAPVHAPLKVRFHAFIRGVTLFADQDTTIASARWRASPLYHREASCGSGDASQRVVRTCVADLPDDERAARTARIRTCYFERLIFDHMYRNDLMYVPTGDLRAIDPQGPVQDDGHRRYLDVVRRDFQTCFPDTDLRVDVEYMHGADVAQIPESVTLTHVHSETGAAVRTEVYRRAWRGGADATYHDMVHGTRLDADGTTWAKAQTEAIETPWLRALPLPPNANVNAVVTGGRRSGRPATRRTVLRRALPAPTTLPPSRLARSS